MFQTTVHDKKLVIFGDPIDEGAVRQITQCLQDERAVAAALCADHHLGYSMPIGGVIAYEDAISPSGVGYDIACGNKAVKTNILFDDLTLGVDPHDERPISDAAIKPIMREIQKAVAFGLGRSNPTPIDHQLFDSPVWPFLESLSPGLKKKAAEQLGTVGSGNHYVDLLTDEDGVVWIANHFGSRGLGHTIATGFLNLAAGKQFSDRGQDAEEPTVIPTGTDLGQFYVEAMHLAGVYAYAGRDYVIEQVLGILGAEAVESVHNHHNFAWHENGRWVVRKGATPLSRELAFIGGSMGDESVIVRGKAEVATLLRRSGQDVTVDISDIGALGSAPHGAGRVMSRTAAAGKLRKMWLCTNRDCPYQVRAESGVSYAPADLVCPECGGTKFKKERVRDRSTAAIDWSQARAGLSARGIVVLGAGADESPGVYKQLGDVLDAHSNIEVVTRLKPFGVVMAGPDEYDPFKD